MVCHRCDVRGCVNPEHLFLGTGIMNMTDAAQKGRMNWKKDAPPRNLPRGDKHHAYRLTPEIIKEIRSGLHRNIDLSRRYGIAPATISRVKNNKNGGVVF